MHDGTHWQDGTLLTVDDVVFSLELAKNKEDLQYTTFWNHVNEGTANGAFLASGLN